jgi:hypothetical protein
MEPAYNLEESNMTPEQIDEMLTQLGAVAKRRRQLIDEYNMRLQTDSPVVRPSRPTTKQGRPVRLPLQAYRRSPERFFWTTEGKSAIRFKQPHPKPCFICDEKSNVEIVDKYGKYQCCTKHGKILANRLGIHIEGMTEKEQQSEYDDMTSEEIQALLDKLYNQIKRMKGGS